MANTRIIADLRRHRGDSSFVIELVRRFASVYGAMTVDWVVRPDQANLLPPEHVIGQADSLDTSWSTRIRDCFVQMAQGDPGGSFWALSYDNAVLAPCEQLKLTHGLQISSKHLRELISNSSELLARPPTSALAPAAPTRFGPMAAGYAPRAIPPTFQPASTLSLAEGIELAKRVLLQGKHTSVESALRQTDLRPRMTFVDGRAAKQVGHFESEALISNIVDAGMQQGWLKRTRRTPGKTGTQVLYIVQAAPPAAGGAGPACQPAPPADQMEPPPLKAIPASDEVTAGGGAGPAASAIPEPPPVSAEANPQEARRKFPNRASVFEAELSKSRIGSMPRDAGIDLRGSGRDLQQLRRSQVGPPGVVRCGLPPSSGEGGQQRLHIGEELADRGEVRTAAYALGRCPHERQRPRHRRPDWVQLDRSKQLGP